MIGMNQKHKLKSFVLQGTALLLFFSLSFCVTAVSAGLLGKPAETTDAVGNVLWEDLLRPSATETDPAPAPPENTSPEPSTDELVPPIYLQNLSTAFHTGLIDGYTSDRTALSISERVEQYNRLTAEIAAAGEEETLATYESYTANAYKLVKRLKLDSAYLTGTEIVDTFEKIYSNTDASYITVSHPNLIGRKTVETYMGYLLISSVTTDDAGEEITHLALWDRFGNELVANLGDKEPYYARDYSNRPVFKDSQGELYAFTGTKFVSVGLGDLRSNLYYDYPAYPLGTYQNRFEAHYSTASEGYNYIDAKTKYAILYSDYPLAFNFSSEGLAVVETYEGNVQIINTAKKQVIRPRLEYTYYVDITTGQPQRGRDIYYFPDTLGIESIGCAGFDHGWIRMRVKLTSRMPQSMGMVVRDHEVLLDTEGNLFDIPEGYTIAGYSDGILLLEKDGYYGYYSINGEWIAQPIYTYARPFIQGLAVLGSETGTVGMIDTEGNIVLPFVFTSISDVSSGVITAFCEGIGWETYELVAK